MSWRDRDYYRQDSRPMPIGPIGFSLPKPTSAVKYLLIANFAMFVITSVNRTGTVLMALALKNVGLKAIAEFWTLVTYQFLHGGTWHLLFNMLVLYFLGTTLERHWGAKRFLIFYLSCGVVGGLVFLLIGALGGIETGIPIVGASGAVLGVLAACAMLFPQMMIILLFFPLPIRVVAVLLGVVYLLNILSKGDLSDACHFGGMLAGLAYVWGLPRWQSWSGQRRRGRWEQRLAEEQARQERVDKILAKVNREGIASLSRREKKILRDATERQRRDEQEFGRRFR